MSNAKFIWDDVKMKKVISLLIIFIFLISYSILFIATVHDDYLKKQELVEYDETKIFRHIIDDPINSLDSYMVEEKGNLKINVCSEMIENARVYLEKNNYLAYLFEISKAHYCMQSYFYNRLNDYSFKIKYKEVIGELKEKFPENRQIRPYDSRTLHDIEWSYLCNLFEVSYRLSLDATEKSFDINDFKSTRVGLSLLRTLSETINVCSKIHGLTHIQENAFVDKRVLNNLTCEVMIKENAINPRNYPLCQDNKEILSDEVVSLCDNEIAKIITNNEEKLPCFTATYGYSTDFYGPYDMFLDKKAQAMKKLELPNENKTYRSNNLKELKAKNIEKIEEMIKSNDRYYTDFIFPTWMAYDSDFITDVIDEEYNGEYAYLLSKEAIDFFDEWKEISKKEWEDRVVRVIPMVEFYFVCESNRRCTQTIVAKFVSKKENDNVLFRFGKCPNCIKEEIYLNDEEITGELSPKGNSLEGHLLFKKGQNNLKFISRLEIMPRFTAFNLENPIGELLYPFNSYETYFTPRVGNVNSSYIQIRIPDNSYLDEDSGIYWRDNKINNFHPFPPDETKKEEYDLVGERLVFKDGKEVRIYMNSASKTHRFLFFLLFLIGLVLGFKYADQYNWSLGGETKIRTILVTIGGILTYGITLSLQNIPLSIMYLSPLFGLITGISLRKLVGRRLSYLLSRPKEK